jgi:hypothetical protein
MMSLTDKLLILKLAFTVIHVVMFDLMSSDKHYINQGAVPLTLSDLILLKVRRGSGGALELLNIF